MESDCPKQYLTIGNKTVIEQTAEIFLGLSAVRKVVVTINPEDDRWYNLPLSHHENIVVTMGGDERFDSVLNGLQAIEKVAQKNDWVLVHDAVRPCVRESDIKRLFDRLAHHPVGGLLCAPVSDTLKRVDENNHVGTTVDRSRLWQAQTPQMFRYGLLLSAMIQAKNESHLFTDESSVLEFYGYSPLAVRGHKDNIKITHPEDLFLAKLILHARKAIKAKGGLS